MKTMTILLRREMWEHKGMLLWTPAVVAAVMTLFAAAMLAFGFSGNGLEASLTVNGQQSTLSHLIGNAYGKATVATMAACYMTAAAPVFLMLGTLVFFYCLGALYDERRDRSLLFWKSLPVSDAATVWSKAALALAVAPAITVVIGALTALLMLLMLCAALAVKGVNLFGYLLATPDFYLTPLRLAALLPVYALWALPAVGWLLMVSAWARSKVFLWAVGAPLLGALLLLWANRAFGLGWNLDWFMGDVVGRVLLGAMPGFWFLFDQAQFQALAQAGGPPLNSADVFLYSWATLASLKLWAGAAAGVAMIFAAVWLRRWREEG